MAGLADASFQRLIAIIKGDDAARIPVGRAHEALVDRDDVALVSGYCWNWNGRYAYSKLDTGGTILMHRLIVRTDGDHPFVDHIDGNGLNNQRHNLRACNHQQNMCNRVSRTGQSKFKGVYPDRSSWRAQIKVGGRKLHLGSFASERKAAKAYDAAAIRYHGEFARTNADLGLY